MSKAQLLFALPILVPFCALAQNGPVQISQSSIAATGLNRNTNGFPYIISQPGSYQLTSNLTVPGGVSGIVIAASNVTLDLNGFSVIATCTGGFCGSYGIADTNNTPLFGITVRNGNIQGFMEGIFLLSQGVLIEKVKALFNGDTGILCSDHATVIDSVASHNRAFGIRVGSFGLIKGNQASQNSEGIETATGAIVTGNTADNNTDAGFILGSSGQNIAGNNISGNTASLNGGFGFTINCPSNLIGNAAYLNTGGSEFETGVPACNKANNLF